MRSVICLPALGRGVLAAILGLALTGPAQALESPTAPQRYEFTEPEMGVPFRIVLYAADAQEAQAAAQAAFNRIAQLNQILSDYETDSELNELSRTSGDVFQRLEIDGRRYSHIVDPRTGVGLTDHSLVTVIAPDGMTADALATTVSVLGPEKGLKFVEQTRGAEVHVVRKVGERIETLESSGFSSLTTAR